MSRTRVPNQELAADAVRVNLLVNGGFEVWQRGTGPIATNGLYAADRWQLNLAGTDTMSVSRSAAGNGSSASAYCAQCTYTAGTGAASSFIQTLRTTDQPLTLTQVSLSIRVYATVANAVRIGLNDGTQAVYSGYHPGDSTWRTLTCTMLVAGAATFVSAGAYAYVTNQFYIDNASLVVGPLAADYVALHVADEIARCQRYYEVVADGAVDSSYARVMGIATAVSQVADTSLPFRVQKAVTPTITKNGTWSVLNSGQPYVVVGGVHGFVIELASLAAGVFYASPGATSGNTLLAEANP